MIRPLGISQDMFEVNGMSFSTILLIQENIIHGVKVLLMR